MKNIAIIGAGPGGLAAGLLLQKKGFNVTIYEKMDSVGGRSRRLNLDPYHFDMGPTFLMYIDVLKEVFQKSGFDLEKELKLIKLDPLYTLTFNDKNLILSSDLDKNIEMYENIQKGLGSAYHSWYLENKEKMEKIKPILEKPFPSILHVFRKDVLKAINQVHPFQSVYKRLSIHSKNETFIHSLSFQSKYLGMTSFKAPSLFTILPYLEHVTGLYHVLGGLNSINHKISDLFLSLNGIIKLSSPVDKILVKDKKAYGLISNGKEFLYDKIVINSDFSYTMNHLIDQKNLKKYSKKNIAKMSYSISTYMVYLGLNKKFDFPFHNIIFSNNYNKYLNDLENKILSDNFNFYIHNPSLIDNTYAPDGHSSLYILVPVPNLETKVNWTEYSKTLKDMVFKRINDIYQIDLTKHIEKEMIYTPNDWNVNDHIHLGAVFNLSHSLNQMLSFRPHNKFEEIRNVYLVGGGTHPGSGLPTIYQFALILNDIIKENK